MHRLEKCYKAPLWPSLSTARGDTVEPNTKLCNSLTRHLLPPGTTQRPEAHSDQDSVNITLTSPVFIPRARFKKVTFLPSPGFFIGVFKKKKKKKAMSIK